MLIETPQTTHLVTYYEIISPTGLRKSISIDHKAGDTYNETETTIEVMIAVRPFLADLTKTIPAQYIQIFKPIFAIEKWTIEVPDVVPNPSVT